MTKFGFVSLVLLLAFASIGCFAGAALIAFARTDRVEVPCDALQDLPTHEGPVILRGCHVDFGLRLQDPYAEPTFAVRGSDERLFVEVEDPERVEVARQLRVLGLRFDRPGMAQRFAERRRALEGPFDVEGRLELLAPTSVAHAAGSLETSRSDARIVRAFSLRLSSLPLFPLLYGLVFALLLAWLLRAQRVWEEERRAWERAHGVEVEGTTTPQFF
ncbi:MAG: hypothetical protein H6724_09890 [Sandaracinus sp.]|nr:hypothetical protein [Sandaracinus sp.]